MKYIITESRLDELIFKFLDSKLEGIKQYVGEYINIVWAFPGKKYGFLGRSKDRTAYVSRELVDEVATMFSFEDPYADSLSDIFGKYIESRYNLKVKFTMIFHYSILKVDII